MGLARPSATGWEKGSYVHYPIFEGWKRYELANHLGNVLAVITDRKRGNAVSGTAIQWFEADVVAAQQYYPFGMLMPGNASAALRRQYTLNSYDYRYGFNGKEGDDEIKGDDNQQDYGMRIYDPRVARFLSVDPIASQYPELTPYQFASNTPIQAIDLDGLERYHFTLVNQGGRKVPVLTKGEQIIVRQRTIIDDLLLRPHGSKIVSVDATQEFVVHNYLSVNFGFGQTTQDKSKTYKTRAEAENAGSDPDLEFSNFEKGVLLFSASVEIGMLTTSGPPKALGIGNFLKGSGPAKGIIEVSSRVKSVKQFLNWSKKGGQEYVFDSQNKIFLTGDMKHRLLVSQGGLTEGKHIVGGTFKVENGAYKFTEESGTYHQNWTDEIRTEFKSFMKEKTGKDIDFN